MIILAFVMMLAVIIVSLAGILDTHVAYATHTGGGAYEAVNTAGYGNYTCPVGAGRSLMACGVFCATPAGTGRLQLTMPEWDGEPVIVPMKGSGTIDAYDLTYLKKPRYVPGGGVITITASHTVNEAVYVILIFHDPVVQHDVPEQYQGESYGIEMTLVAAHVANVWTQSFNTRFPSTRGPFLITSAYLNSATMIIGRMIIPQAPNSCRPPVFGYRAPVPGVEGSPLGRLIEPIGVPEGETVTIEGFATSNAAATSVIEACKRAGRAETPPPPTTGGQAEILGVRPSNGGGLLRLNVARSMLGAR